MRTTLTLDPDIAQRLLKQTQRTSKSLKASVNDALRLGLGLAGEPRKVPRYQVKAHPFGLEPGIDPDRLSQLVDELEADRTARKLRG